MDLERTISSGVSQTCQSKWNLKKNDKNNLIYKTEADSETQKTNLGLPQEKRGHKLGVLDEQIYTQLYKTDKQQEPAYSIGNYIQSLVITYNEKQSESEEI